MLHPGTARPPALKRGIACQGARIGFDAVTCRPARSNVNYGASAFQDRAASAALHLRIEEALLLAGLPICNPVPFLNDRGRR
jgi:hypothetical protein